MHDPESKAEDRDPRRPLSSGTRTSRLTGASLTASEQAAPISSPSAWRGSRTSATISTRRAWWRSRTW
ncbi:MAG TPA: hypothetical protein VJ371_21060, partial [Streptosporangiaceae bacterium]|nr:hypothetical protein [Streptosporangiaceae bacterium]